MELFPEVYSNTSQESWRTVERIVLCDFDLVFEDQFEKFLQRIVFDLLH